MFNLTVDVCPEYFANGVLVHNCDAMRYATRYVGSHMLDRGTDGGYGAPEPEEYNGW